MPLTILPGSHADEDFDLDDTVVRALWRMEDTHFWPHARNEWIAATLAAHGVAPPARVLEVGCGSGAVAGALGRRGYDVTGIDTAEILVRKAHERFPALKLFVGDVAHLPAPQPFDAIGFFDVLEHLSEPEDLLRWALKYARSGTLVIATVPADRSLHSVIDDASGHKKRYELGELSELFARVGLAAATERGIFRWTSPLQRIARLKYRNDDAASPERARHVLAESLRVPARPVNAALGWICALERRLAFARSAAAPGPSLIAVATVP